MLILYPRVSKRVFFDHSTRCEIVTHVRPQSSVSDERRNAAATLSIMPLRVKYAAHAEARFKDIRVRIVHLSSYNKYNVEGEKMIRS